MEATNNLQQISNYRFYGCYQGNYQKHYRWQCKAFSTSDEATQYTHNQTRDTTSLSILVPINKKIPIMCDKYIIKKEINRINQVDIN